MKKLLIAASFALVGVVFAEEAQKVAPEKQLSPEILAKRAESSRRRREKLVVPGSQKGVFLFANADVKSVPNATIAEVTAIIAKNMDIKFDICESKPATPATAAKMLREKGAAAGVFIVYEKDLPILLSAPEENWVILNARALKTSTDDEQAVAKRMKCEIFRAFSIASGSHRSQFGGNVMSADSLKDLDRLPEIFFPYDVYQRIDANLTNLGITPLRYVRYSVAVREGWAPAPTNDVQREIVKLWEEQKARRAAEDAKKDEPKK